MILRPVEVKAMKDIIYSMTITKHERYGDEHFISYKKLPAGKSTLKELIDKGFICVSTITPSMWSAHYQTPGRSVNWHTSFFVRQVYYIIGIKQSTIDEFEHSYGDSSVV